MKYEVNERVVVIFEGELTAARVYAKETRGDGPEGTGYHLRMEPFCDAPGEECLRWFPESSVLAKAPTADQATVALNRIVLGRSDAADLTTLRAFIACNRKRHERRIHISNLTVLNPPPGGIKIS